MADIEVNLAIPPDAHPGVLRSGDRSLEGAMAASYKTWSSVATAEQRLDERAKGERPRPPGRRMDDVEKAMFRREIDEWSKKTSAFKADLAREAQPKIESALKTLDRSLGSARARAEALEREIQQELVPRPPDTPYDVEIRARLREDNSLPALKRAIDEGDPRVVAAIVGSPPMLLGVEPRIQETLRELAVRRVCPEKREALELLQGDVERVQRGRDMFLERMTESVRDWRSEEQQIIQEALHA